MYSHLSKKEKRKQLAQARKRALLWSIQQQTVATLKKSALTNLQSTSTYPNQSSNQRDPTLKSPDISFYTALSLPENRTLIIQEIWQTLANLQKQKEAIDITIDVLQHPLTFLKNAKTPR